MGRNNFLFIVSGISSLSLFTLVLVLFFYMLFSSSDVKSFSLKKDDFISVSIEIPNVVTKKTNKSVTEPVETEQAPPESKEVDIDNLFSDVWTKKIKKKPKKKKIADNKRIQQIQKKINTKKENKVSNISEKLESLDAKESDSENKPTSSADEVNEYFAKIQALVYQYFYPPQNSQGYSVKAVIELSSLGKVLDFRILNYSTNTSLNEECDKIKTRLKSIIFPINPENRSGNYIIILRSEE